MRAVFLFLFAFIASHAHAMPVETGGQWRIIFAEDFNQPAARFSFASTPYYQKRFKWYGEFGDGVPDTAQQTGHDRVYSGYYANDVVEVRDGLLIKHLHTAKPKLSHEQGNDYVSKAVALMPQFDAQGPFGDHMNMLYGKYTIRFRAAPLKGFKTAWLLWPKSEAWPRDGEIDFPEGPLDGTIHAFMHRQNGTHGGDQDAFSTRQPYTTWNTASIEWMPGRVNFILNDQLIGCSDSRVPNTPMRYVIQTESCLEGCPDFGTAGKLEIDWITIHRWAGDLTPQKCN